MTTYQTVLSDRPEPPVGDREMYEAMLVARTEKERLGRAWLAAHREWVVAGRPESGPLRDAVTAAHEAHLVAYAEWEWKRDAWLATLPQRSQAPDVYQRAAARGQLALFSGPQSSQTR